jgi:hypothetical protein
MAKIWKNPDFNLYTYIYMYDIINNVVLSIFFKQDFKLVLYIFTDSNYLYYIFKNKLIMLNIQLNLISFCKK